MGNENETSMGDIAWAGDETESLLSNFVGEEVSVLNERIFFSVLPT